MQPSWPKNHTQFPLKQHNGHSRASHFSPFHDSVTTQQRPRSIRPALGL